MIETETKTKNWYSETVFLSKTSKLDNNTGLLQRLLFKIARRWVSGNTYKNALSTAKDCNSKGILAILNYLGEDTTNAIIIENTVKEYFSLLSLLESSRIDGCISVKPTQLGLRIAYDESLYNFRQIARKTKSLDRFMWIDIESIQFVEDTISIYLELLRDYKYTTGVAIQSYLKRSSSDLLHLMEQGASVRLVKGAYSEDKRIAFQSIEKINSNFSKLMKMLFEYSNTNDNIFAIATHDPKLIDEAIVLSKEYDIDNRKFEFQFLMGIQGEMKENLVKRGFRVSEYIPYGNQWLPYSMRRIRERKRNILLLARSLLQS
ncbi:MAG TPA: proline dehydrogenase family protein [Nitrososphaeraceae archaeon]|nr:proline dehydrogenase family protein [Nitrososphaeraceae archaeon]